MFLDDIKLDRIKIGSFSLNNEILTEMPKIGTLKKFNYNIYIYENDEGQIPHFHILDTEQKLDCCIRISENRYFKHGKHQSELNSKERKALNEFLSSVNEDFEGNYWKLIKYLWNQNNSRIKVTVKNQPNYRQINAG